MVKGSCSWVCSRSRFTSQGDTTDLFPDVLLRKEPYVAPPASDEKEGDDLLPRRRPHSGLERYSNVVHPDAGQLRTCSAFGPGAWPPSTASLWPYVPYDDNSAPLAQPTTGVYADEQPVPGGGLRGRPLAGADQPDIEAGQARDDVGA